MAVLSGAGADKELARMLLRLRFFALYHLIELGDSATHAVAIGEPLTEDLELALGPHHPETLAGRERVLGADHPDTVTTRTNLGSLLPKQQHRMTPPP